MILRGDFLDGVCIGSVVMLLGSSAVAVVTATDTGAFELLPKSRLYKKKHSTRSDPLPCGAATSVRSRTVCTAGGVDSSWCGACVRTQTRQQTNMPQFLR